MTNRTLLYMHAEGSWPDVEGITEESVGSFMAVNDDAAGHRSIDVTELWFAQELLEGTLKYRVGKMDLTTVFFATPGIPGAFDASEYANDETGQFVSSPLVNNPTIPFPDNGLGGEVLFCLKDRWHISAAAVDAQADGRETGFNTTFHQEDYFFAIAETGLTIELNSLHGPLSGSYRVGLWYDPQAKKRFTGGTKRDDIGFYASFDQVLYKENDTPKDTQGLGVFARYGWAESEANEITSFWSMGIQYRGLLPNRDTDVLGCGMAQGIFSDRADIPTDAETIMEIYYNAQVTPWVNVTPNLQYVAQPAGADDAGDALVMGIRMQMRF